MSSDKILLITVGLGAILFLYSLTASGWIFFASRKKPNHSAVEGPT